LLKEKLALIYEYNRKSPLFVQAADLQLSYKNLHIALDILSEGLKIYPDYPTAYFLLGKILVLQGEYKKAEKAFIKGSELLNNKSTLNYYINEMETLRTADSHFTASRRVSFASDELTEMIEENNVDIDKIISDDRHKDKNFVNKNAEFEDRLDDIAKEISSVKIIVDDDKPIPNSLTTDNFSDMEIITETMANIYLAQRKLKEAINIFERLKIKFPQRTEDFQKKIEEIKIQMNL
jgi:tetratricopeptide (TPR) repeat protein